MRNISLLFWILLLVKRVPGVDEDTVKLKYLEGDLVVLHTSVNDISNIDKIQWFFGKDDYRIALIGKDIPGKVTLKSPQTIEKFKDRLQLNNKTGSLTITNIKTEHSGDYKCNIETKADVIIRKFNVTVRVDTAEEQSVMEHDSVSLLSRLKEITSYHIRLRFKDQVIYTASLNGTAKTSWSNIHLDNQTKELSITNVQSNQSGVYDVEVENVDNIMIFHKKCKIIVERNSGVSPGAAAGIVVGLLVFHCCLQL